MKKMLILSDSHGRAEKTEDIILGEKDIDIIVHLGDGSRDISQTSPAVGGKALYQCRGNCDYYDPDAAADILIRCENILVMGVHGDKYGVKQGLTRLSFAARSKKAGLCLFGHTHLPFCEEDSGIIFLNPGSAACGKYAVVTVDGDKISAQLKEC